MGYMWIVSVYVNGRLTRRYTAMLRTVEDIFWHVQFNYGKLELDGQGQNCFTFCNDDSSLYVHYQN